jgi:hypothetical protein
MSSSFFSVLIFLEAGFSSVPLRFLFDLQSFNECGSSITAMKSTRHCKNCGSSFNVDSCNVRHHSHCPVAACRSARRALAQACRRASKNATRTKPAAASRLQRTLKPTEADLLAENPTFIGLISLLTGSSDLQEIQITARRLYRRGSDIPGIAAKTQKNAPSV